VVLDGRVVAVRRLSREVTVQTSRGVYRVAIAPSVPIQARGASGWNAVRGGATVHLDAIAGNNGKLVARAVAVR